MQRNYISPISSNRPSKLVDPSFVEKIPESFLRAASVCVNPDALLRQVSYDPLESKVTAECLVDPVGDSDCVQIRGVLQKYYGRILLLVTGACFGHCRYCFRKNFSYEQQILRKQDLEKIVHWLNKNKNITEVILSGGDPLCVSNAKLQQILNALESVSTLRTVRVHTRVLSFYPQRIDEKLQAIFSKRKWQLVWVFHFNHMGEITGEAEQALQILKKNSNAIFLNQSVLLKGVNDTEEDLILLSENLFRVGILPYYLHQLDRVKGASHFEVPLEKGKFLVATLREKLPGYLVPKYVQEIPAKKSKTPIV